MDNLEMLALPTSHARRHNSRGISLIIVLIMMIIIGITTATAMRSATSEQRATNNLRVESTALQYAEAALRYCENQMRNNSGDRPWSLQTAQIGTPTTFGPTTSGWEDPATWTGSSGRKSATRTEVPDSVIQDTVDTVLPNKKPECVVENMTGYGVVITARGFSPDYEANVDGTTKRGAVVWLQSITN